MEENTSKEKQIHQELFEVEKKMKQMDISYVNSSHFRDKELILSDLKTNEIQLRDLRRSNEVIEAKLVSKGMIDEEFVLSKQSKLNLFNDQLLKIQQAIKYLEDGLLSTQKRAHEANLLAFSHIQKHFQKIFKQVVPRKKAFLQLSDQEKAYVEQGVYFDVRNDDTLMTNNNSSKATKELSGGQLTMLSMSYVFALACFSASPLYMLDEIDAALDEHNQVSYWFF
jgi:chromosome segregation ATPase